MSGALALERLDGAHRAAVAVAIDTGIAEMSALLKAEPAPPDRAAWIRWNDNREELASGLATMRQYAARRWRV